MNFPLTKLAFLDEFAQLNNSAYAETYEAQQATLAEAYLDFLAERKQVNKKNFS